MVDEILKYQGTYWGREEMAEILQATFSNSFSSMKIAELDSNSTEIGSLWPN